jgi:hypothetical protein
MATLAGIYLRLDPFETRLALNELHDIFRDIARPVAREIYGQGVEVEVRVQLGSLRGRALVVAAVIYPLIAQYPDFRSGLGLLVEDAKGFATQTSDLVVKALGADQSQVKRVERRTGVPGQLRRLIEDLDHLAREYPTLTSEELHHRSRSLDRRFRDLERQLGEDDTRFLGESLARERERHDIPIPESVWESMPFLDEATRRGKSLSDLLEPPGGIKPGH